MKKILDYLYWNIFWELYRRTPFYGLSAVTKEIKHMWNELDDDTKKFMYNIYKLYNK